MSPVPNELLVDFTDIGSSGAAAHLTLNRPEKRNALSDSLLARLEVELAKLAERRDVRAVVIAAAGPVFSAGHDLSEMVGRSPAEYQELFGRCTRVMLALRRLPQPVIARVQGLATAAGCQLVAACDLAVAATSAAFATPGVKIGLFCTTPMVPLVRTIAPRTAMEMLLTGEPISAHRAYELGLVNRVVAAEQLDQSIDELVQAIVRYPPEILALGKQAFYEQLPLAEATAYEQATEIIAGNASLPAAQEGIEVFVQKRRR